MACSRVTQTTAERYGLFFACVEEAIYRPTGLNRSIQLGTKGLTYLVAQHQLRCEAGQSRIEGDLMRSHNLFILIVVSALVACGTSRGPAADDPIIRSSAVDEIRAAQEYRFAAMIEQDLSALAEVLSDDLTYTHTSANLETKTEFQRTISSGAVRYEMIQADDVRVRVYGTTGIADGRANFDILTRDGRRSQFSVRFTEVFVRQDGRWRTVAWQSTRVPD